MPRAGLTLPLVVDVDTGIDDAVALAYLLASPEAEILAITCTAGNVPARLVAANTLAWLDLCGAGTQVEVGLGAPGPLVRAVPAKTSHGPLGLGHARLPEPSRVLSERSGPQLWVDAARRRPGEVTGLVTGPLTSLALALRAEPELPRLLGRLVLVGGAFDEARSGAEWNLSVDPDAARIVLDAFSELPTDRLPIVCPLDLTQRMALTPGHVHRLAALAELAGPAGSEPDERLGPDAPRSTRSRAANPLVRHLSDALRFAMEYRVDRGEGYEALVHDALAAAVAIHPELVRTRPAAVRVRGGTGADWDGRGGHPPNAAIAVEVDPAAVLDDLVDRLGALARDLDPARRPRPPRGPEAGAGPPGPGPAG